MVLLKCFIVVGIVFNIFDRISGQCTAVGAICSADCETTMACTAVGADPKPYPSCSDPSKPYCTPAANGVNSGCSAKKSSQCSDTSTGSPGFQCTEAGLFPDTSNCARYHICIIANGYSEIQDCPPGQTFDSNLQICKDGKVICYATSCPANKNGVTIAFKMNPAYYTLCMGNDRIILKCPDVENQIWNGSSCVYPCKSMGLFPDIDDCKVFYECTKKTGNAVRRECFADQYFDGNRCVTEPIGNPCGL